MNDVQTIEPLAPEDWDDSLTHSTMGGAARVATIVVKVRDCSLMACKL